MGGLEGPPKPPECSERPAKPWRSSVPEIAPQAPIRLVLCQRLAADPGRRDVARRVARSHVARAIRLGAARAGVAAARWQTAASAAALPATAAFTAVAAFATAAAFTAVSATTAPASAAAPRAPPPPAAIATTGRLQVRALPIARVRRLGLGRGFCLCLDRLVHRLPRRLHRLRDLDRLGAARHRLHRAGDRLLAIIRRRRSRARWSR